MARLGSFVLRSQQHSQLAQYLSVLLESVAIHAGAMSCFLPLWH